MFEQYSYLIGVKSYKNIDIDLIFANQEVVFYSLLNFFPDSSKKYHSPFRQDKKPGCRFNYYNGILYLIDNAGYKGKIAFNCIETCMYLYNFSFKEAIYFISERNKFESSPVKQQIVNKKHDINIKFTYTDWNDNNYFTNNYNVNPAYLNNQPYYNVVDYWVNTKKDPILKKNLFINPRENDVIAYYFEDSDETKLYFPNQEFKFYSNAKQCNLFGMHRIGEYIIHPSTALCICSSGKDELCLNYHTGIHTLALQSESQIIFPDWFWRILYWFDPIYIWLDNDLAGIQSTKRLVQIFKSNYTSKTIIPIYQDIANDIADITQINKSLLKVCINKSLRDTN